MLLGRSGEYVTFKQCQQEGGRVRKGEKAHMVVFWKWVEQEDEEMGEIKEVSFLRYYSVFHIDQCEGLTAKYEKPLPSSAPTDETAEAIISAYCQREGVSLTHTAGDSAFYRPSTDTQYIKSCFEKAYNTQIVRQNDVAKMRGTKKRKATAKTAEGAPEGKSEEKAAEEAKQ